jgi:hypothetical protein
MLAHSRRYASAPLRRRTAYHRYPAALAGLCVAALLAGCTVAPPAPIASAHPANPDTDARPTAYRPVIGPYASQRPHDPSGWRQNNERVAPQEKP